MRISDWSSDVCSSDLFLDLGDHRRESGEDRLMIAHESLGATGAREQRRGHVDGVADEVAIFEKDEPAVDISRLERERARLREIGADMAGVTEIFDAPDFRGEIGRASGRERMGPYV